MHLLLSRLLSETRGSTYAAALGTQLIPSLAEQHLWSFHALALEKTGWEKLFISMVRSALMSNTLHERLFSLQNIRKIDFEDLHSEKE